MRRHQREVALDDLGERELGTVRLGAEGPIRYATDVEFLVADKQEFPVCARAETRVDGGDFSVCSSGSFGDERPFAGSEQVNTIDGYVAWLDVQALPSGNPRTVA
jgi:hypothetical protein